MDTAPAEGESGGVFGTDPTTVTSDLAQPIFTRGDILAEGNMDISGNALIHGNEGVKGNVDISGSAAIHQTLTVDLSASIGTNLSVVQQIRSSTLTSYAPSAAGGSASSLIVTPLLGQVHKITIGGTAGGVAGGVLVLTANSTGSVGMVIYVIIINSASGGPAGDNAQRIDFNTNFRTISAGVQTLTASSTNTYSFVSDGTAWYQIGVANAISA